MRCHGVRCFSESEGAGAAKMSPGSVRRLPPDPGRRAAERLGDLLPGGHGPNGPSSGVQLHSHDVNEVLVAHTTATVGTASGPASLEWLSRGRTSEPASSSPAGPGPGRAAQPLVARPTTITPVSRRRICRDCKSESQAARLRGLCGRAARRVSEKIKRTSNGTNQSELNGHSRVHSLRF